MSKIKCPIKLQSMREWIKNQKGSDTADLVGMATQWYSTFLKEMNKPEIAKQLEDKTNNIKSLDSLCTELDNLKDKFAVKERNITEEFQRLDCIIQQGWD